MSDATPTIKILILEDHISMRHAIVALLRRSGYEVDATANPFEALEMLVAADHGVHPLTQGRTYDLLLVDHDLGCPGLHLVSESIVDPAGWTPRMDGAMFIAEVRRLAEHANVRPDARLSYAPPIIGISAMASLNERMVKRGAVAGMPKGDFQTDLLPLIARVLTDHGYRLPE